MKKRFLTRNILLLSVVSLLADVSGELLYPVMPLYLATVGFDARWIGLMEGLAEAMAGISKAWFGRLSDRIGKRLPFVQTGYTLSAVSKPLPVLWAFAPFILFARTLDRLGKGMRSSSRDAILAAESDAENRGKVFGFHRSMDTLGAVIGPLLGLSLLYFFKLGYTSLFWIAAIPALAGAALTFVVSEKKSSAISREKAPAYWKQSTTEYRQLFRVLVILALFNSSDMFLILLAGKMFGAAAAIWMYVLYNIVYAASAYIAGALADRAGMKKVLSAGLILFIAAYLFAAFTAYSKTHCMFWLASAFVIYGAAVACLESSGKAWLSRTCLREHAAGAMGLLASATSIATLIASVTTGFAWELFGPSVALFITAGGSLLALFFLLPVHENKHT